MYIIGDDKIAKQNYSVARVVTHNRDDIGKFERHIERKNDNYSVQIAIQNYTTAQQMILMKAKTFSLVQITEAIQALALHTIFVM